MPRACYFVQQYNKAKVCSLDVSNRTAETDSRFFFSTGGHLVWQQFPSLPSIWPGNKNRESGYVFKKCFSRGFAARKTLSFTRFVK